MTHATTRTTDSEPCYSCPEQESLLFTLDNLNLKDNGLRCFWKTSPIERKQGDAFSSCMLCDVGE